MKRKITINSIERTTIVAALMAYSCPGLASCINAQFEKADPALDGPEVEILKADRDTPDL